MHILYIHQYFATPNGTIVTRAYEFSRLWTVRGHKITMLTTTACLTPEDLRNATGKFLRKFNVEGINVLAFNIAYSQKMSSLRRYSAWLAFLLVSMIMTLFIKNVDIIYARSTPLTVGIPAVVAKWLRKIPFVFEVTDQWPEIPIEMGVIKNRIMIRLLLWLEKTIYKHSDSIIACSPGMSDGIRKVMARNKLQGKAITMIPNFSETTFYRPDIEGSAIRKKYGWGDKLVFLHAGTMGKANSLDFIIEAAGKVRHKDDIHFVLIGDGSEKTLLAQRVGRKGLKNIEFLDPVPKMKLPEIIAACDVSMVIFANYPILEHNSANKFFDSLSAGKPVLLNYSGWQRKILEDNTAGYGCDLCNIDEFVEKVLYLDSHRDKLSKMGQNARIVAIEQFDRNRLASQALDALCQAVGADRGHKNFLRQKGNEH